jgi:uncharacterized integral membrane protein
VAYLSLGVLFITLSGIAIKESHCFSLYYLKLVPVLLVLCWFSVLFAQPQWAAGCLIAVVFLYLYMAWKKLNMPLFYDFGDRKKHEI